MGGRSRDGRIYRRGRLPLPILSEGLMIVRCCLVDLLLLLFLTPLVLVVVPILTLDIAVLPPRCRQPLTNTSL